MLPEPTAEGSQPSAYATPAAPQLPTRAPDRARPRIQGLAPSASELRKRQLAPTSAADREHLKNLAPLSETLASHLHGLDLQLDGFQHALLCTAAGTPLAHLGISGGDEELAASTSALLRAAGGDEVDHVVVRLGDGALVVVISCGSEQTPLLLTLRASGVSLGVFLHVAQRVADACETVVRTADDASGSEVH